MNASFICVKILEQGLGFPEMRDTLIFFYEEFETLRMTRIHIGYLKLLKYNNATTKSKGHAKFPDQLFACLFFFKPRFVFSHRLFIQMLYGFRFNVHFKQKHASCLLNVIQVSVLDFHVLIMPCGFPFGK
jgi:hypothetical protein